MPTIPIHKIVEGDRMRDDYGDLESLKKSILRFGLIQPIVLDPENNLIAGGRRLAAHIDLELQEIDVVYKDTPDGEATLREMELEENISRKDMNWIERVQSIDKIHRMRVNSAAKAGDSWTSYLTSQLLNVAHGTVSYATKLAKLIEAGDEEVMACSGPGEAYTLLARRREDETRKLLVSRLKPAESPVVRVDIEDCQTGEIQTDVAVDVVGRTVPPNIHHMSALDWTTPVTSIITDPPYAIDMDMLQQAGSGMDVSRTAAEHDERGNKALLEKFINHAVEANLFEKFLVMWCDPLHFRVLYHLGIDAGLAVQRWPLVWNKTSACMNQAAQYNTTKNYEIAIVMRTKRTIIPRPVTSSVLTAPNLGTKRHPFEKPFEAWEWLYKMFCNPGDSVLDPFAGVGSSLQAAASCHLTPHACELKEEHYAEMIERVNNV